MNYFAHAITLLNKESVNPYEVAGTAVPDWLNVVDRKVRARERLARPFTEDSNPPIRALARGIVQHHRDDDWFHQTTLFAELSMQFTLKIRECLQPDNGFRAGFLGHILVELFLDTALIDQFPEAIEDYYRLLTTVDEAKVERGVSLMATRPADRLAWFIQRFVEVRFLFDYAENEKLLKRLNQIMQRVKLPRLTDKLFPFFDDARQQVAARWQELMPFAV